MSTDIQDNVYEQNDYIYQRLRTQMTSLGKSTASQAHTFFVFGASV